MRDGKENAAVFSAAEILLPRTENLSAWAVIACDQFTSQPEYWQEAEEARKGFPSALDLILPESELAEATEERISQIHRKMEQDLQEQLFRVYPDCFLYTERSLQNGETRCGLIGKLDLEAYDYTGRKTAAVRATEKTVTERIPPRMAVRRGATLELPHVLLLCDDELKTLIDTLSEQKRELKKLYDFELMLGGGHLAGWLVDGEKKTETEARIRAYETHRRVECPEAALLYCVGDGNHSLATAKACYEELKKSEPEKDFSEHLARYALCELNNIREESQEFEPIHRLVKHCDCEQLLADLRRELDRPEGTALTWIRAADSGILHLTDESGRLPLAAFQDFLDRWLAEHPGELDYIHGEDELYRLGQQKDCIGFLLPAIEKESLFPGICAGGVLPRKAFSIGEARDKRYYLEARKIQ